MEIPTILPLDLNPKLIPNIVPNIITEELHVGDKENFSPLHQEKKVAKFSLVDSIKKIIASGSHTKHQIAYECNLR
jgi:hypothetical protein